MVDQRRVWTVYLCAVGMINCHSEHRVLNSPMCAIVDASGERLPSHKFLRHIALAIAKFDPTDFNTACAPTCYTHRTHTLFMAQHVRSIAFDYIVRRPICTHRPTVHPNSPK